MGRANSSLESKYDTQSLILGPVSTPTPSIDAGRETPAVTYRFVSIFLWAKNDNFA